MKNKKMLAIMVMAIFLTAARAGAQEKSKDTSDQVTPVKITVIFTEYEGEKKISSLPYTFPVNAKFPGPPGISMRLGLRVPILAGHNEIQYQAVGTNLDCDVETRDAGGFKVHLFAERNFVYAPGPEKKAEALRPGEQPLEDRPIFSEFRTNQQLLMRDGQTIQAAMATDPVSGRVLKIDVTLNLVK